MRGVCGVGVRCSWGFGEMVTLSDIIVTVYGKDTVSILSIYRHYFFYVNQVPYVGSYGVC